MAAKTKPETVTDQLSPVDTAAAPTRAVVFRDKKFKRRTLFFYGKTYEVERSRVVAGDPDFIDWLSSRDDFERTDEVPGTE